MQNLAPLLIALLLSTTVHLALAQRAAAPTPSEAELTKEMLRIEDERARLFNDKALQAPKAAMPLIMPTPMQSSPNIEDIARRYKALAQVPQREDLYVFASFTMPEESLKRLIADATLAGATVVFRGYKDNSIRKTTVALAKYKQKHLNAVVDPNAFTKYKVTAVPTVAVLAPDAKEQLDKEGCALPNTFTAVVGDVTLDFALEHVRKTKPQFASIATHYLRAFKGRS